MGKVDGFTINQTDDYSALISGTAPSGAKKLKIKVTAANADGKVSKTITLETSESSSLSSNGSGDGGNENIEIQPESDSLNASNPVLETVTLGAERSIKSLGSKELNALEGYTVAAVMPEISTSESGMYDFEVDLAPEIGAGKELFYFAFVRNREKNDDDEIAEFFDTDGKEITETTGENEILISIWLNSGDIYAPVIAVKDSE